MRFVHLANMAAHEVEITAHLRSTNFAHVDFEGFVANVLQGARAMQHFRQFLPGHILIPDGFQWDDGQLSPAPSIEVPSPAAVDRCTLLEYWEEFLSPLAARGLAVQCSGGLDSSLIGVILSELRIPFCMIGLSTERYEFRTERRIQQWFRGKCATLELIDLDSCLPMSELRAVPAHALPSLSSLGFASERAMTSACKRLGVGVLLSGSGGDVILADQSPERASGYPVHMFGDWWLRQYIFEKDGVQLSYPFADPRIVGAFWRLRAGAADDPKKRWARSYFSDWLPPTLSQYAYKSDFWGVHTAGLLRNLDVVREIHAEAYASTLSPFFASSMLEALLARDIRMQDQELHQRIEAHAALAVWVCGVLGMLGTRSECPSSSQTELRASP